MRCCNIINSLITGFPPDPVPDPDQPGFLWYAELTGVAWNAAPTITINGVSADILLNGDGLKNAMQGQFGLNTSGGWYIFGTLGVFIFIYQVADPTPDVEVIFEGNPLDLTWTQGDTSLTSKCYEAVVAISDTPADNVIRLMTVAGGSLDFFSTGATLDVLISTPDTVLNLIQQSFGDSASLSITDLGSGNIQFQILNTIIEPGVIIVENLNTSGITTEPFVEIPCPRSKPFWLVDPCIANPSIMN